MVKNVIGLEKKRENGEANNIAEGAKHVNDRPSVHRDLNVCKIIKDSLGGNVEKHANGNHLPVIIHDHVVFYVLVQRRLELFFLY